jgi:hypothetical protein
MLENQNDPCGQNIADGSERRWHKEQENATMREAEVPEEEE